jgi:hypothetical protein
MKQDGYLNLDEARKENRVAKFAQEHRSTGDEELFDRLLNAMAKTTEVDGPASSPDASACCDDTQTRPDTTEDTSRKR